jgi:hypothetical protein
MLRICNLIGEDCGAHRAFRGAVQSGREVLTKEQIIAGDEADATCSDKTLTNEESLREAFRA